MPSALEAREVKS